MQFELPRQLVEGPLPTHGLQRDLGLESGTVTLPFSFHDLDA